MTETSYAIRELPWDTELFEVKMGEVLLNLGNGDNASTSDKLRHVLELARRQSYRFLICQLDVHNQEMAEILVSQGAHIGDTLITLELNLMEPPESLSAARVAAAARESANPELQITSADSGDLPVICDIAAESFSHSRIYQDSRFDPTKVRQFYPKWIRDSFGTAERVYTLKNKTSKDNILGFVSLQDQEAEHRIGIRLIAVDKHHRGSGYGQVMMDWLIREAITRGFQRIQVGTQTANTAAIHFYKKNGFRPISTKHRFHIWID